MWIRVPLGKLKGLDGVTSNIIQTEIVRELDIKRGALNIYTRTTGACGHLSTRGLSKRQTDTDKSPVSRSSTSKVILSPSKCWFAWKVSFILPFSSFPKEKILLTYPTPLQNALPWGKRCPRSQAKGRFDISFKQSCLNTCDSHVSREDSFPIAYIYVQYLLNV